VRSTKIFLFEWTFFINKETSINHGKKIVLLSLLAYRHMTYKKKAVRCLFARIWESIIWHRWLCHTNYPFFCILKKSVELYFTRYTNKQTKTESFSLNNIILSTVVEVYW
jgi:hypothetical protein